MTNHLRFSTAMFDSRRNPWYDRGSALGFSGRSHASSEWWFPPNFVDQRVGCLQGEPNLRRAGVPCLWPLFSQMLAADSCSGISIGAIYRCINNATPWVICWVPKIHRFQDEWSFFSLQWTFPVSTGSGKDWKDWKDWVLRIAAWPTNTTWAWFDGCPIFTILIWFPDRGSLIFMGAPWCPSVSESRNAQDPNLGSWWFLMLGISLAWNIPVNPSD